MLLSVSVPNRFSGIRDFPYLKLRIRDSGNPGEARDKKYQGRWDAKDNHRDYGIVQNIG